MEMSWRAWHSEDGVEMSTWKTQVCYHHAVADKMAGLQKGDEVYRRGCIVADLEKSRGRPTSSFDQFQEVCSRDLHAILAIVVEEHLQVGISGRTQ